MRSSKNIFSAAIALMGVMHSFANTPAPKANPRIGAVPQYVNNERWHNGLGGKPFATRYKINKCNNVAGQCNVADGDSEKLALARAKRTRKANKRRKDYNVCSVNNILYKLA